MNGTLEKQLYILLTGATGRKVDLVRVTNICSKPSPWFNLPAGGFLAAETIHPGETIDLF